MIANLLTIAGIDHVITLDLHVGASGFVTIDSTSSRATGAQNSDFWMD
jgi:phosphoribosylpyrophosphate synthetase